MKIHKQNGEGSVIHDTAGGRDRWIFQYTVYNAQGVRKRRSITRKTKSELFAAIAEFKKTHNTNELGQNKINEITCDEWFEQWLIIIKPSVRPGTFRFYNALLKHASQKIGRIKLSSLTIIQVQTMLNELLETGGKLGEGLAPKTVRSLRTTLISCIEFALENGYITKNVAKKTRPPKLQQKNISYLDMSQVNKLIAEAEKGVYLQQGYIQSLQDDLSFNYIIKRNAMIIRLALATGMRRGELFGLSMKDINFDDNSINIHQAVVGGKIADLKTANSLRRITIDSITMDRMRDWLSFLQEYAEEAGSIFDNKHEIAFPNKLGRPLDADTFRRRYFSKIVKFAGLPDSVTMHSLRHTHCTILLENGVNANVVANRLGHSSSQLVLSVYGHVTKAMEKSAADLMQKLWKK